MSVGSKPKLVPVGLNLYKIWDKSGNCWYIRASYSFEACEAVNRLVRPVQTGNWCSSWDVVNGAPATATIIDAWAVPMPVPDRHALSQ